MALRNTFMDLVLPLTLAALTVASVASAEKLSVSDSRTDGNWYKANQHCRRLTEGGHDHWRLPTFKELGRESVRNALKPPSGKFSYAQYWTSDNYGPAVYGQKKTRRPSDNRGNADSMLQGDRSGVCVRGGTEPKLP